MLITAQDASKNIRVRIGFRNGKPFVETISNANLPKGCDAARSFIEEKLQMGGDVESAASKHPVEEKITTPSPAQIEEVQQIQRADESN